MMQSTDDFTIHSEGRGFIFQEIELSSLANETEKHLEESIGVVEKAQYKKFVKPINVYAAFA